MRTTLLRIDSSLRTEGSYSRELGDFFIETWEKQNPSATIKQRDVSKNAVAHLNQETLACFFGKPSHTDLLRLSNELIDELVHADDILFTVPMYNFGMPSTLKAYFDLVVRVGKTYVNHKQNIGLLKGKRAYIITSMGAENRNEKSLVEVHLQAILSHIGITDIHCLTIDGTADQKYAVYKTRIKKNEIINLLNT
ncbi:FMN-dependent NADH-azoreductase [Galbibacter sp.]|uniref:FMN-dependent NADH-azoreductase n=1 Tax=Galbibacter sp. TaxID=2918471 RepID=UPI003A8D27B9